MSEPQDKDKHPINMDVIDQMINDSIADDQNIATNSTPHNDLPDKVDPKTGNPTQVSNNFQEPNGSDDVDGNNNKRGLNDNDDDKPDESDSKRTKPDNLELELEMAIENHNKEMENSNKQLPSDGRNSDNQELHEPSQSNNPPDHQVDPVLQQTNSSNDNQAQPQAEASSSGISTTNTDNNSYHKLTPSDTSAPVDRDEVLSESNPATDTNKKPATVVHQGINIPADSELLNSHSAFTVYSEFSSQLPTLPTTSNNQLTSLPLAITAADYLPPRIQLLVNTLPTLDNLATQILRIFTLGPYQKIIDLVSSPESAQGAVFTDLTSLFEFTKKLYSEDEPFLNVTHVAPGIWRENERAPSFFKKKEQTIESTLRKVNLSTFLLATLGVIEVGFFYLNESFLNIFCPLNNLDPDNSLSNGNQTSSQIHGSVEFPIGDKIGKLLKPQAILYLDLKTQAYISAIEAGERSREEILGDIFPDDLEQTLLEKRGLKTLSPAELDFIERCKGRRTILLNYPDNSTLSEDYEWFQFLKSLFDFISKNMVFLIWGNKRVTKSSPNISSSTLSTSTNGTGVGDTGGTGVGPSPGTGNNNPHESTTNSSDSYNKLPKDADPVTFADTLLPSEILEQQLHVNRASGKFSNRRPWTREEEKALRHALELKGPHWSSILELFGAGGKISEALKNRTQVQLKDKARNWKKFFLKSELPVPQYLQKVTGDLDSDKLRRAKRNAAAPIPNIPKG